MYFCPFPFTCWKYTFELLVTGMLCHSKVWSRVWTHRCNVNMNPYISVCPFSVFHILLDLFPQSVLAVYQPSSFIFVLLSSQAVRWALLKGGCVASLCSVELSASICLDLPPSPCPPLIFAPSSLPLSASVILIFTFLYCQEPCSLPGSLRCMRGTVFTVYSLFPVKQMSQNWLSWEIHC